MRTLQHDIQHLLATEGVVARRDHPKLIGTIDWLVRNGNLRPVLPGVYAEQGLCDSIRTRILALMHWDPDAVLLGSAAARVSFWPEIRVSSIMCSLKHHRRPQPGYEFTRQLIPAELVVNRSGIRYTSPALTALDLCGAMGGDAIDQALRARFDNSWAAVSCAGAHGRTKGQSNQAPVVARLSGGALVGG